MDQNKNSVPPLPNDDEKRAQDERKKKKVLKIVLVFSVAVIALSLLFSFFDPEVIVQQWFSRENDKDNEEIYFYREDDELNTLENEEYLQMDSRMFYHNPFEGVTYSIEEEGLSEEDDAVIFFYNYFAAVKNGDAAACSEMFSSSYKGEIPEDFTVQMIYDINVYPQTEGGEIVSYRVDYKIHRNNGTFRDDVGSDVIRPLLFTLVNEGGEMKIGSIVRYTSYVRN
ncbi:MAG: hypothetical protein IJW40_02175 [Clostridia bacterium]|nr:hypothetical protein [Clostridia bacterium]